MHGTLQKILFLYLLMTLPLFKNPFASVKAYEFASEYEMVSLN